MKFNHPHACVKKKKYKYEYVLIYVNVNLHKDMLFGPREEDHNSIIQLINVIIKAYDNNFKIIVVINNIDNLKLLLTKELDSFLNIKDKPRNLDRIKTILPGLL